MLTFKPPTSATPSTLAADEKSKWNGSLGEGILYPASLSISLTALEGNVILRLNCSNSVGIIMAFHIMKMSLVPGLFCFLFLVSLEGGTLEGGILASYWRSSFSGGLLTYLGTCEFACCQNVNKDDEAAWCNVAQVRQCNGCRHECGKTEASQTLRLLNLRAQDDDPPPTAFRLEPTSS